jgi:hypothetical protein
MIKVIRMRIIKNKLMAEVSKIDNKDIKSEINDLIKVYEGNLILDDNEVDNKIEYVLSAIFGLPIEQDDIMIPLSFFKSQIGNLLMYVKYNQSVYDVKQLSKISGYSYPYLIDEIVANRLKAKYFVNKNVASNYLRKKGKVD